ncbi:DUF485 domain-containing protein [Xylophilus sp. GOD-11R]|uniref:DUF485 domain-containing protein n=1 Tax=Xylophilus sp. GOD-11R TaxID=3089814 RepID=UPI00298C1051|nr:DUF485 domain-containing protein [Xylophilus sp. GOD-11R]WPB55465.1 DUF485 domain-containing protein [Xylophilus sp. GOD-11R]
MSTAFEPDDEKMGLGLCLTAVQVVAYFSFVACCAFGRKASTSSISAGDIPGIFYGGAAVIATGIVLTITYVLLTNRGAISK